MLIYHNTKELDTRLVEYDKIHHVTAEEQKEFIKVVAVLQIDTQSNRPQVRVVASQEEECGHLGGQRELLSRF